MATAICVGAATFRDVRYAPGMKLTRQRPILTMTIVAASLAAAFAFRKFGDINPVFAYLEQHSTARKVVRNSCALVGLDDEFDFQMYVALAVRVKREIEDGTSDYVPCANCWRGD